MRKCLGCGETKPIEMFGLQVRKNSRHYPRARCKSCRAFDQSSVARTPEKKALARELSLKRLYGIDCGEYNQLFTSQGGRCAGCGRHQAEFSKALHVDHCHKTGKVRGLLCGGCNLAIGNIKERPDTLYALAEYLKAQK